METSKILFVEPERTIYKYEVKPPFKSIIQIDLPINSQILDIQVQHKTAFGYEFLCFWCLIDKNETMIEKRFFHIIGTGEFITPTKKVYLKTIQMPPFVWHIFEALQEQL